MQQHPPSASSQPDIPSTKKAILMKLLRSKGLRYRDAAPEGAANDLYNYHLQHLIRQGYVIKSAGRYHLTMAGKQYIEVVRPLAPTGDITDLFRVNVLLILMRAEQGRLHILNQTRKRHPYYDDKGILGGPVKPGELLEDAYPRILARATGLTAAFKTIGVIRKIRFTPDGVLFSDIIYHIGLATKHTGELAAVTPFGENYWADYETALRHEQSSMQGGASIVTVLRELQFRQDIPFFFHQDKMTVQP